MASSSTPSIHKRSNNDASSSTPPVHKKSKFDASPSSPSIHKSFKYDVFLSFRGIDTRTNFVDHLYDALQQKGIQTYKDDERITKGKQICDELIESIQESKLYIIVFSKNYASSSWCLDELVKIMECQKTNDHTAYPVFYDVEPTEVRHQSGAVEEAFKEHENKAAAGKWRMALKEAANLAGWELADGHETKFIKKVVEEISLALRGINSNIDDKLVGMKTRISGVLSSFETGYNDTRMIGIKGMGGAGKTTLARAIFDRISFQFEGKSFVENVRELSGASFLNLKSLQNQILSDVFNDKSMTVSSVHEGIDMMKKRMRGKKVILVLDDVDHREQLKALAGDMTWFKPGSIIIITTRDQQVLEFYEEKLIHDVQLLSDEDAMCLFRRNAFRKENPSPRYEELSQQFVNYAAGLPLAIEVLGSFLCGKNELEWMDALSRLKTIPPQEILEILEISFCGLEKDYKEIFLNVACFLKRWRKDKAFQALESCGYYARNGLRVLELKSLITVDQDGRLGMHDHIVEMGMNIVRRSHPDSPNKHSRLWIDKEIKDILTKDLGTEETRYIQFEFDTTGDLSPENVMKGLRKMKELRFLRLSGGFYGASEGENWKFNELPNALQYLCWRGYPFRSLPTTFHADNLVTLKITHSRIVQLWEGEERKVLNKLKFLDLSYSKLRTFDLGVAPNLETLNLRGCDDLIELLSSDGCLNLRSLIISGSKLSCLDLRLAPNLETLNLRGCDDLIELLSSDGCLNLRSLIISGSKLSCLDLRLAPNLETLDLEECHDLIELLSSNGCLKLRSLIISGSKLSCLDLRLAPNLETLDLEECHDLIELLSSNGCLKLRSLIISGSKLSCLDLRLAPNLETLDLEECHDLIELLSSNGCLKLRSLIISGSKLSCLDLRLAPNLETLDLGLCYYLIELLSSDGCLKLRSLIIRGSKLSCLDLRLAPNLETLHLEECDDLIELLSSDGFLNLRSLIIIYSKLSCLDLRLAPNLETLDLRGCYDLVELLSSDGCLNLRSLTIIGSKLSCLDLRLAPNLETLDLGRCYDLIELRLPETCLNLRSLIVSWSKLRTLDIGLSPKLKHLDLRNCHDLEEIHMADGCLENIVHLNLVGCLRFESFRFEIKDDTSCSADESLEGGPLAELHLIAESLHKCDFHPDSNLPKLQFKCDYIEDQPLLSRNLEKLISVGLCACTNIDTISRSICGLQHLRKLKLQGSFPEAPKALDQLECLQELDFSDTKIRHLPDNICVLKHLKSIDLFKCSLLEKLPEDLGQLECLEKLVLSYTKIKHLPGSICKLKHLNFLDLGYCSLLQKLPEDLGQLQCLKKLDLSNTAIKDLPDGICMLKHLGYLDLSYCSFLEKLPEDLGQLECLKRLNLWFAKIKYLPDSICMLQRLESLDLSGCSLLEKLPEDLGRLECLEDLDLRSCELLRAVPDSICNMKCLKHLNLEGCIRVEKLPEEIGRLKCLKSLKLHNTGISHLPQSIFLLQGMRIYGSRGLLQSSGFTSEIQRFYGDSYYNALIRNNELEY